MSRPRPEISQVANRQTGQAARICARMKHPAADGETPENVSVKVLAMVTAGLAKLVDEVNQ